MDESKRQLWVERFDEQANSGMTIDAWCTKQQLSKYTFYYWKQRIRKEKLESMVENTPASMFAKLEISSVQDDRVSKAGLVIRWQGFEMVLTDHRDITLATQFIRQLSQS